MTVETVFNKKFLQGGPGGAVFSKSRTEINCSFLDWDQVKKMWDRLRSAALEQVGTVFEYKEYKFFNVNVDVVESDHQ